MKLGRAAIVSLVELTIDFLLSIINAVLTTKQGAFTHTLGFYLGDVTLREGKKIDSRKRSKSQILTCCCNKLTNINARE